MPDMDKRLNYFTGQFLQQEDFTAEQEYHVDRQRRHSRLFHTPGIADGLNVTADAGATEVVVSSGTAADGEGRQIVLTENRTVRLEGFANQQLLLVISYREQPSDPATVGGGGDTRWHENPLIEAVPVAGAPPERTHIRLAGITTGPGGAITAHDSTVRVRAGAQVGDELSVRRLSLSRPGDAPNQWPVLSSGATGRADLTGVLSVSGNVQVGGTLSGTLAANIVSTGSIANNAVTAPKLADAAVTTAKLADGAVSTAKLADLAVNAAKLANNSVATDKIENLGVTTTKLQNGSVDATKLASHASNDAARAVTRQHLRNNAVGTEQIDNLAVNTAKLADNAVAEAKLDAATRTKLNGALQQSGGTATGAITVNRTWDPPSGPGPGPIILSGVRGLTGRVNPSSPPDGGVVLIDTLRAAVAGESNVNTVIGVHARAPSGTHALVVSGTARATGGFATGHIIEIFVNASGQRLRTGDVVRLKGTGVSRFQGDANKIPVAEVTLVDTTADTRVIGVVDREAIPDPDTPDTRVKPEDSTFVEDGGDVFVVTQGVYAHCRVDASEHPIEVGDLLTSSVKSGHAQKAVEPRLGTIIGKALEPLSEGTGYIAVFVNLY
jgi:hypothetical protein